MDKGLDKEPPYNLSLNKIATTLDAETAQEDDNQDGAFVNSLTHSGTRFRREEASPSTRFWRKETQTNTRFEKKRTPSFSISFTNTEKEHKE